MEVMSPLDSAFLRMETANTSLHIASLAIFEGPAPSYDELFEVFARKLAELPRNSSATRIRNRCEVTGRPRGYYRKHKLSRIALRDLGSKGLIPGLLKSSW